MGSCHDGRVASGSGRQFELEIVSTCVSRMLQKCLQENTKELFYGMFFAYALYLHDVGQIPETTCKRRTETMNTTKPFSPPSIKVWGSVTDFTANGCTNDGSDCRQGSNHVMDCGKAPDCK